MARGCRERSRGTVTIHIPVWAVWTIGILAGVVIVVLAAIGVAFVGAAIKSLGRHG